MKRRSFIKKISLTAIGISLPGMMWAKKIFQGKAKEKVMKTTYHKANTRGVADHGWLNSHHTFSFANYFDPNRMGFGALRVINDDIVAPARGFGTHPHENMEIISIPIRGSLKHKDTIGNEQIIKKGEVQAMSAGTGLMHSEYNHSETEDVNFLQIWVLPKKKNIKPNYSQKLFNENERINSFQLVVSPDGQSSSVEINQDAYFSMVKMDGSKELAYNKHKKDNGVYFFVLNGGIKVDEYELGLKDGLGVENSDEIKLSSNGNSEVLIMEVPMKTEA